MDVLELGRNLLIGDSSFGRRSLTARGAMGLSGQQEEHQQ